MKKVLFVILFFCFSQFTNAQFFKNNLYYEGEVGFISSFLVKDQEDNTTFFTFGGVNLRGGVGVHDNENIVFLGIHSGMDANFRHGEGILPVYLNSKLAFDIGEETKLIVAFGYGKSFQIGPENRNGYLRKYTIAIGDLTESENMQSIFIEVNNHGYNFPDDNTKVFTINFGYTYTFL